MAVSPRDRVDLGRESSILSEIKFDTGFTVDAVPLRERSYEDRTISMADVRRDGIDL